MQTIDYDIAIPVYNEELRLEEGVRQLCSFLRSKNELITFQITIADNGSIDKTESIAVSLEKEFPEIRYLKTTEKGIGRALKKAWLSSTAETVGYMDVDLSTDLHSFNSVIESFKDKKISIITGSRLTAGAIVKKRKLTREITSRVFNFLLKFLLKVRFSDGMCGFKFIRKKDFELLLENGIENNEWFFNTELLIKSEWASLEIKEIPVLWVDDPNSKNVKLLKLAKKYMKEIFRLRKIKMEYIKKYEQ